MTTLYVNGKDFSNMKKEQLVSFAKINIENDQNLTEIILQGTRMGEVKKPEWLHPIFDAIGQHKKIRSLELTNNLLYKGDNDLFQMIKHMVSKTNISKYDFSGNGLGKNPKSLIIWKSVLENTNTQHALFADNDFNRIPQEYHLDFCSAVEKTKVNWMDLNSNHLCEDSDENAGLFKPLGTAIRNNNTIEELKLAENDIGDDVEDVQQFLEGISHIPHLRIGYNDLSNLEEQTWIDFLNCIKTKNKLKTLDVSNNDLSEMGKYDEDENSKGEKEETPLDALINTLEKVKPFEKIWFEDNGFSENANKRLNTLNQPRKEKQSSSLVNQPQRLFSGSEPKKHSVVDEVVTTTENRFRQENMTEEEIKETILSLIKNHHLKLSSTELETFRLEGLA